MARKRMNWIEARNKADKTQHAVEKWFLLQPELEPHAITQWTLSRFEKGDNVRLSDVTLRLLAECYGQPLSEIDPEAAAAYEKHRELVIATMPCMSIMDDESAAVAA